MVPKKVSVVLPVLNEEAVLEETLRSLAPWRVAGHEVIVADGGSSDATPGIAGRLADRVVEAPRGRARQMNAGAAAATGDVLLFLHADTRLPPAADRLLLEGLESRQRCWGRFDVRLSGNHPLLRLVEYFMNLRSRWTGIATGDQAMFIVRELFCEVGGFADLPLMEDVELCSRLKRRHPPLCLRERVVTSSRRWESRGILRTIFVMWTLRLAYALGVSPARLARLYR